MQVRIEDVSPIEKKLIVEIPWSTVNTKLDAAYRDLARNVRLKGFRQGKARRSVLQQMFGKRINAEVTMDLIRESFLSAVKDHDLKAVSEPRVETAPVIKRGQPLAFEAIVEVRGEIEAIDFEGVTLRRRKLDVGDDQVDAELERLRAEHVELLPIEGRDTTARTDVVTAKITGTVGEHEVDQDRWNIDLTDPDREPIPGLIGALTGLPLDVADHEVELAIPDDYRDQDLAGKTAKLTVSFTDARLKQLPELDDEFAQDTGKADTLDELKADIRAHIELHERESIARDVRRAARKELVKRNQIEVAPSLVERGIQFQYERLTSMFAGGAGALGEISDSMRENLRPMALDELRGELLIDAVGTKENIEVSEEALDAHIAHLAEHQDKNPARLRAELERDDQLDDIKYQLRQDAILDWLIERAEVIEMDAEELAKLEAEEAAAEAAADGEAKGDAGADSATSPDDEPDSGGGDASADDAQEPENNDKPAE